MKIFATKARRHQGFTWGDDSFTYCYSEAKRILALVLRNAEDIVIAFRRSGANTFSNWLTDIDNIKKNKDIYPL